MADSVIHSFLRPDVLLSAVGPDAPAIPKTIWQTTNHKRLSDPQISAAINGLRLQNPDWKHICSLHEDVDLFFAKVGSDRLLRAIARIAPEYPQARMDMYRYLRLFLSGGAYFDDKSGASRPLSTIIQPGDSFVIAQSVYHKQAGFIENLRSGIGHIDGGGYLNWFIASSPGHPYLAKVLETAMHKIESYSPLFSGTGKRAVLEITGPMMYTKAIAPIRTQHPHRVVLDQDVGLLYSVLAQAWTHEVQLGRHYSTLYTPPVLPVGLGPVRRLRYEAENLCSLPFATLRKLNGMRRARRRKRKAEQAARDLA